MTYKQLSDYITSKEKLGLLVDLVHKDRNGVYQPNSKLAEAVEGFEAAAGQKSYSQMDVFYMLHIIESLEMAADKRLKEESLASEEGKQLKILRNRYMDKKEKLIPLMDLLAN